MLFYQTPDSPSEGSAFTPGQQDDQALPWYTWQRKASPNAQISLGGYCYFIGRAYANRPVSVRFDPAERHLLFFEPDQPDKVICRRRARGLEVEDLTGLALWPTDLGPQQLPLPLFMPEGVNF